MRQIPPPKYDTSQFNADYYGKKGNNGFGPEIHWDNPLQQDELSKKFAYFSGLGIKSILFVGCAQGQEVRYFEERGIDSFGLEVSEWAVKNALPEIKDRVYHYSGSDMHVFGNQQFDAVACFDVLTLLPLPILVLLGKEMQRVAKHHIVFRATFKTWENKHDTTDGQDGVVFVAPEFYDLDRAMSGDFRMDRVIIDAGYSGVFWYVRRTS